MVQCEMCGKEVASPKSTKIEGAILRVCQECSRFGAEIKSRAVERGGTKYQIKHKTGGTKRGVVKNKKRLEVIEMRFLKNLNDIQKEIIDTYIEKQLNKTHIKAIYYYLFII